MIEEKEEASKNCIYMDITRTVENYLELSKIICIECSFEMLFGSLLVYR